MIKTLLGLKTYRFGNIYISYGIEVHTNTDPHASIPARSKGIALLPLHVLRPDSESESVSGFICVLSHSHSGENISCGIHVHVPTNPTEAGGHA